MTALVETSAYLSRTDIAREIMASDSLIEQVGFILPYQDLDFYVEMMGGELCINAASCAAYRHAKQTGKTETECGVSGLR